MSLQARYTILRKIADGGTAEIFLATQKGVHGFEKVVVLKRIFPAYYADPQFRDMLVNEAHIAMSFNHSNIVQVLDLGEDEGQYILALELVDGWTLDAVIRRVRAARTSFPPALALYVTAEVCRALAYAHAKTDVDGKPLGIVHRDISPHNVLLSEQGEVKLTDFGIATARDGRDQSGEKVIKGKIAYMSPEQAAAGPLDARSDLFSVGTMLYVMACGRYPFDAPTDLEMLLLVKNGEAVPPEVSRPGIHPEISRILKRAMAKDPAARYQRADDMLLEVEQVMRAAFRAVGQTELKRWLQDLSTRDGVPALTKAPALPSSTPAGRVVGAASPSTSGPAKIPPPPPASGPAAMAGRPPPPPAAWSVGRKTGQNPAAPAQIPQARQGRNEGAPLAPLPGTADTGRGVPASVPSSANEATPPPSNPSGSVPTIVPADGSTGASGSGPLSRAGRASSPSLPRATGSRAILPPISGVIRPPLPSAPHVPPPPVSPQILATLAADTTAASTNRQGRPSGEGQPGPSAAPSAAGDTLADGLSARRWRRLAWFGVGLGGLLVVFVSIRACSSRRPAQNRAGTPQDTTAAEPPTASAPSVDARVDRHLEPVALPSAPLTADAASDEKEAAATAGSDGGAARSIAASPADAASPSKGALVVATTPEPAGGGGAAPPPASPSAASVPEAGREIAAAGASGTGGTGARPAALSRADASAEDASRLAGTAIVRPSTRPLAPDNGAAEGDGGDSPTDGAAESNPRVTVKVKSVPPGAQVKTAHHDYGTTPTSIRLRAGNGYALTFTHEGFRPLSKHVEITAEPDQEISVTLKKAPPAPPPRPVAAPAPPPPRPAPPPKPANGSWWQKMFKR